MIVAVGGDKGSPGATTLAVTLATVWPGERVLAELDPRGADLPFRLHHASGGPIRERPSIAMLAVDARPGNDAPPMDRYTQWTSLGLPLIPGELSIRTMANLMPHMPTIAKAAAAWRGMVIADLGALLPTNPALALAKAASVTLLVTRANLEGLSRLVERVDALGDVTGNLNRIAPPVGVVVVSEPRDTKAAVDRASRLLAAAGSPAPVLGAFPLDLKGVAGLYSAAPTKKLWKSSLFRAGRELTDALHVMWPELTPLTIGEPNSGQPRTDLVDGTREGRGEAYASANLLAAPTPPSIDADESLASTQSKWQPPTLDWPAPGGPQR